MSNVATHRLIDASAALGPAERALLNLWIHRGLDDPALARMTRMSLDSLAGRRRRIVESLSEELGLPPDQIHQALTEIAASSAEQHATAAVSNGALPRPQAAGPELENAPDAEAAPAEAHAEAAPAEAPAEAEPAEAPAEAGPAEAQRRRAPPRRQRRRHPRARAAMGTCRGRGLTRSAAPSAGQPSASRRPHRRPRHPRSRRPRPPQNPPPPARSRRRAATRLVAATGRLDPGGSGGAPGPGRGAADRTPVRRRRTPAPARSGDSLEHRPDPSPFSDGEPTADAAAGGPPRRAEPSERVGAADRQDPS